MEIEVQPAYVRLAILIVVVVLLLLACVFGFRAGRDIARADFTLKQTGAVMQGFMYFLSDQDRYPGQMELQDASVMRQYISQVPIPAVVSKQCPTPFGYETFDRIHFTFSYCLPRGTQGMTAGTHKTTETDITHWK